MFDPHKGQWWSAPQPQRFEAYYMTLRVHYGMPALEAFTMAKKNFAEYSGFFGDPIGTLRAAVNKRAA